MKYKTIIDPEIDDEIVLIYARERTAEVEKIEKIVSGASNELIGYEDSNRFCLLDTNEIERFFIEENKLFAGINNKRYLLKQRLYTIEGILNDDFIKINQSCIVNIKRIERFEVSFSGGLLVVMKSGYKDYVSRRQMKFVKERLGIKK